MNLFNLIAFTSLILGTVCWAMAYVLMIKKSHQDKSIAIPLIPLALNFSWEFLYTFVYPATFIPSRLAYGMWFIIDVVLLYSYYKFSEKKNFTFPVLLVFFICCLVADYIFEHYMDKGVFGKINPLILLGFIADFTTALGLIYMLKKKGNSKGQSLKIAGFIFYGTFLYVLEVKINPAHKIIQTFPLDMLMYSSLLLHAYYYFQLKKVIKSESVN